MTRNERMKSDRLGHEEAWIHLWTTGFCDWLKCVEDDVLDICVCVRPPREPSSSGGLSIISRRSSSESSSDPADDDSSAAGRTTSSMRDCCRTSCSWDRSFSISKR